jgi:capsid protein
VRVPSNHHLPKEKAMSILDQYGNPIQTPARALIRPPAPRRRRIEATYDASKTVTGNELHWANADHLDPKSSASYQVRRTLRSRSRYECIENNPYLKGVMLMVCNDFVGSGPNLQITDKRVPKNKRRDIEQKYHEWCRETKHRQKLWRLRMAKMVDGEGFQIPYYSSRMDAPVKTNFMVVETDRCTSPDKVPERVGGVEELDGVRFNRYDEVSDYYFRTVHPGAMFGLADDGRWIDSRFVIHWFRQDRGWLRGIPELTASLPNCAILRRYTLAMLRHAETAASLSAIIETPGPANTNFWVDDNGDPIEDDPFSEFPIEAGMVTTLPWGYEIKQLNAAPFGIQYDEFVGSQLREILRPLGVPFNLQVGSSRDSNMASAVVDTTVYTKSQASERLHCEENVLDRTFRFWWEEARLIPGYIGRYRDIETIPQHRWGWDEVALLHTDPQKVANYLKTMKDCGFFTDQDIQERYLNRNIEDWAEQMMEGMKIREKIGAVSIEEKQIEQQKEIAKETAKQKANAPPTSSKAPPKRAAARRKVNGHSVLDIVPKRSLTTRS